MKTIAIAVAGYNLAETSRMIEIAKEAKKYFKIVFLLYGGQFESLIDEENFKKIKLSPELTEKKLKYLKKVLNGDTLNTTAYFNKSEIDKRVKSEIEILKKVKPVVIITGWNLTVTISSRILNIPFVNVLHSTSIREYYEHGLQSYPDILDSKILKIFLDYEKVTKRFNRRVLNTKIAVKPYNFVGKKYNLKPFNNFIDLIEGDRVFLADIPELVDFKKIRENLHFIGPLPARLNVKIPDEILHIKKDKPIIYFAMGSSGKKTLMIDIIKSFKGKSYYVIAPILNHIKDIKIDIPKNVLITDFLPADKVNPIADIAIIHGGQNTVMNACLSRTPFIGIGMHVEQQANIDACVRKGFAIRLSKKLVTADDILKSIDKLLYNEEANKKINLFGSQLEKWNGPVIATNLLNKYYG